jgi:hypothetical protein
LCRSIDIRPLFEPAEAKESGRTFYGDTCLLELESADLPPVKACWKIRFHWSPEQVRYWAIETTNVYKSNIWNKPNFRHEILVEGFRWCQGFSGGRRCKPFLEHREEGMDEQKFGY